MIDLDPETFGRDQPCFGCGPRHPTGLRLRFTREDDEVVTRFVPGDGHQGPPGLMHGGLVATLADEIAAWTIIGLLGKFGFTATMAGRFAGPVRIGVELVGRGRIVKSTRRTVHVAVRLAQGDAEVYTGELVFALLDVAAAERLLGGPVPESWKKFSRDLA